MANLSILPKQGPKKMQNHLEKIKTEARERRRTIQYLILGYLRDNLLENTAECLLKEAQLDDMYQVCENVELDVILQEYQSYYYTKFQKYPKIIRKLGDQEQKLVNRSAKRSKSGKRGTPTPVPAKDKSESPSESDIDFQFEIISLNGTNDNKAENLTNLEKPKPMLQELEQYNSDNKDLINQIANQVIAKEGQVKWSDCVGLEDTIEVLKESCVYPMHYPQLFRNLIPWKGVLLHGPPGTGKTLLAKALASEGHTTFFNVTSSTFISKWRGESEKMIKYLFDLAKLHSPSTIFFDEIDALVSGNQHEASKRFKSELLVQLDGISSIEGQIFILASTNSPWDLDHAILRRFDKRILVDMPGNTSRIQILKHCLRSGNVNMSVEEFTEFGEMSVNYSGSDIKNVCKEACMSLVREQIRQLEKGNKKTVEKSITFADIKQALRKIRSSVNSSTCKRYYQWQNEHGAF